MYELVPSGIDQQYILSRVSQEEIFEYYMGVKVNINEYICSPLRRDNHPTCNFNWYRGKLWFRDWTEARPMDCFKLVQTIYNCSLGESCRIIYRDLVQKRTAEIPRKEVIIPDSKKTNEKPIIQTHVIPYKQDDIEFLSSFGLDSKTCLLFNMFSIDRVWVNGNIAWSYRPSDPAIGYYFGDSYNGQRWKIYFYKRKRMRFLTNTNRINGWIQLPEKGEYLIITKSLKDVACLHTFGLPAIAMQNESTIPYDYIIAELRERFSTLISLYDYDRTGVSNANKLKKLYGIPYFFFKGVPNVKDFSDFVKVNGKLKTQRLINDVAQRFMETNSLSHQTNS